MPETTPTQTVFVFAHVSSICTTATEHVLRISSITANRNQRLAILNYEASIDSDNHADTWCFGKNFKIICYSGKICDISRFTSQIGTSGTRVGTGVTVWTCHRTGHKIMFEVAEGLDTRDVLNHTLMNPNQSRAFGISICDDPWDPHRELGIQLRGRHNTFIPMQLEASTVKFYTHAPTNQEMAELYKDRVCLTSDEEWDPRKLQCPKVSQVTTLADTTPVDKYPTFASLRSRVNASAL